MIYLRGQIDSKIVQIPVVVRTTKKGLLISNNDINLWFELLGPVGGQGGFGGLGGELDSSVEVRKPLVGMRTPDDVFQYFRESYVLREFSGDVGEALGLACPDVQVGNGRGQDRTSLDLEVVGPFLSEILTAKYPQAEVGRILKIRNAGAGRERILKVLLLLQGNEGSEGKNGVEEDNEGVEEE